MVRAHDKVKQEQKALPARRVAFFYLLIQPFRKQFSNQITILILKLDEKSHRGNIHLSSLKGGFPFLHQTAV